MIKCLICNKDFLMLPVHLKCHKINLEKYLSIYGNNIKYVSDETMKIYKDINTGSNNPRYGIKHTLESRSLMRIANSKRSSLSKKFLPVSRMCDNCNCWYETTVHRINGKFKRKTCSIKCGAIIGGKSSRRSFTEEARHRLSESIKKKWTEDEYSKKVLTNNKKFSSKGEKEIRLYFMENFPDDGWTFGGGLDIGNNLSISRDLYSNKLKVCVEYDGIWHFKDIHGQLEEKKMKDKKLEEWCSKNKYRLIRVREEIYLADKKNTINLIENFIYKASDAVLKIY